MTKEDLREVSGIASKFLTKAINAEEEEIIQADAEARTSAEILGKSPPRMNLAFTVTFCPDGNVIYRFGYTKKRIIEESIHLTNSETKMP